MNSLYFHILIFIISCFGMFWGGESIVRGLMKTARFLGIREFVIAFFVLSFAASLPNFFVGIFSALQGISVLSFGDIVGGNMVDLTLAIAIATFFANGLPAESRMVQASSALTFVVALLPLLLILDGKLGVGDGWVLILTFIVYSIWIFSKKERFMKTYEEDDFSIMKEYKPLLRDMLKILAGFLVVPLSSWGIVSSSQFFANFFHLELAIVGMLVVGIGNSLPEIYFAVSSARKGDTWMILGDLMGSITLPATLILGIVAIISPIVIEDFSPFVIARFFLIISAIFFFFFVKTGKQISKKEGLVLLLIYIAFVITEVLSH